MSGVNYGYKFRIILEPSGLSVDGYVAIEPLHPAHGEGIKVEVGMQFTPKPEHTKPPKPPLWLENYSTKVRPLNWLERRWGVTMVGKIDRAVEALKNGVPQRHGEAGQK